MPFYKLSTEPSDKASVKIEQSGHYCLSFIENAGMKSDLLPIVFDSSKVFGMDTSLEQPMGLMTSSVDDILANPQYGWAKTSSAFAAAKKIKLKPGENVTISSVYGKASTIEKLPEVASLVTAPNFVESKFQRARALINDLTAGVETETVNPLFDGTVRQM
jgi:cellobiose phosphorylase